jgi:hypothetical protein
MLVTNSGGPPAGPASGFDDAAWHGAFELLVMSAVRTVRIVAPSMEARGGGSILMLTSSSVKNPIPNLGLSNVIRPAVSAHRKKEPVLLLDLSTSMNWGAADEYGPEWPDPGSRRAIVIEALYGLVRVLEREDSEAAAEQAGGSDELGGLMTLLNGTAESLERQRAAIEELNQKLSQSQKMEAMGQLTGGVAHDFNNLLTVILGNSEYLAERLAANKELHKIADSIATAAERGSELTKSLLAFARKQPLMPKDIDIGQKILGMEQLLRRTLGEAAAARAATRPTWEESAYLFFSAVREALSG